MFIEIHQICHGVDHVLFKTPVEKQNMTNDGKKQTLDLFYNMQDKIALRLENEVLLTDRSHGPIHVKIVDE